jgi:hypothetical protein
MQKLLLVLSLTIAAGAVQAQNTYQANEFRHDICKIVGKRAINGWKYKIAGQPYPVETMMPSPDSALHERALEIVQESETLDVAVRRSLAMCFDNVDRVFRDGRNGKQTKVSELQ